MPITPGQFGSLVNYEEFDASPDTLPPFAFSSGSPEPIPTRVVLENLPAVAQQGSATAPGLGSPGTCEAQSFGRGLGTYTAARLPNGASKFVPDTDDNIVSAAFLWSITVAQGQATCPPGGAALGYLQRLTAYGSASAAQVPYEPSCCYLGSIDPVFAWPNQDKFRIGSYSTFNISPAQLDFMKELIAAGHAIAFSGPVFQVYPDPPLSFGVFGNNGGTQPLLMPNTGHGQLVVGYDDQMGDPSAPGAFLVQNSFGTAWPPAAPGGRIWWAYDTFLMSQKLAAVAYSVDPSTPTSGQLQTQLATPQAWVVGVSHWVQPQTQGNVVLIVSLHFSQPVVLLDATITEPGTGTQVKQSYGLAFSDGYIFWRRTDGAQFLPGNYGLSLNVINAANATGAFTGQFSVGVSVPTTPTPAPIATPIYDTIGNLAAVTAGQ